MKSVDAKKLLPDPCENLDQLCSWLRSKSPDEIGKLAEAGKLDPSQLPNFGGAPPDTDDYLSYDPQRILLEYETCDYERRFVIVNR